MLDTDHEVIFNVDGKISKITVGCETAQEAVDSVRNDCHAGKEVKILVVKRCSIVTDWD